LISRTSLSTITCPSRTFLLDASCQTFRYICSLVACAVCFSLTPWVRYVIFSTDVLHKSETFSKSSNVFDCNPTNLMARSTALRVMHRRTSKNVEQMFEFRPIFECQKDRRVALHVPILPYIPSRRSHPLTIFSD
jgi:hypothetical protein